jgi:hypothetical protein
LVWVYFDPKFEICAVDNTANLYHLTSAGFDYINFWYEFVTALFWLTKKPLHLSTVAGPAGDMIETQLLVIGPTFMEEAREFILSKFVLNNRVPRLESNNPIH